MYNIGYRCTKLLVCTLHTSSPFPYFVFLLRKHALQEAHMKDATGSGRTFSPSSAVGGLGCHGPTPWRLFGLTPRHYRPAPRLRTCVVRGTHLHLCHTSRPRQGLCDRGIRRRLVVGLAVTGPPPPGNSGSKRDCRVLPRAFEDALSQRDIFIRATPEYRSAVSASVIFAVVWSGAWLSPNYPLLAVILMFDRILRSFTP